MSEAMIAAITALSSVAIGSLVTLYTVRRQVNASLVSASRQQWINTLRDSLAEFLAVTSDLRHLVATKPPEEWRWAPGFERVAFLRAKIALLLNPTERDHKHLLILLSMAVSLTTVLQDEDAQRRSAELYHEITIQSQAILKREWERVKAGEPLFIWRWRFRRA